MSGISRVEEGSVVLGITVESGVEVLWWGGRREVRWERKTERQTDKQTDIQTVQQKETTITKQIDMRQINKRRDKRKRQRASTSENSHGLKC